MRDVTNTRERFPPAEVIGERGQPGIDFPKNPGILRIRNPFEHIFDVGGGTCMVIGPKVPAIFFASNLASTQKTEVNSKRGQVFRIWIEISVGQGCMNPTKTFSPTVVLLISQDYGAGKFILFRGVVRQGTQFRGRACA